MSTPATPLKLRAEDSNDLKILSACFQDALLPGSAMEYTPEEGRFTVIANRFMWEQDPITHEGQDLYKRVHAGLHFIHVKDVKHRAIDFKDPTRIHNLLALHGDKDGEIHLLFSNKGQICLHVEKISCHFKDLHEPWYTPLKPNHEPLFPSPLSHTVNCF